MVKSRTPVMLAALLLAGAAARVLAVTVPPWIQAQLNVPLPDHDARTPAVVLYSETTLTVEPNGKMLRVERQVIKILRPEGGRYGIIRADSNVQSRIIGMHGWNIAAGGQPTDVSDRDAVESAVIGVPQGNLVADVRSKLLRIPGVLPGNVVAGEVTEELQPFVPADDWVLQGEIPIRESRFSLEVPSGWSYKAHWVNHADEAPAINGARSVWTLRDLKAIREEQFMPPLDAISGRLALSLVPPTGHGQGFESWSDVGAWYQNLAQSQRASSPAIKQQVAALTDAQSTLLGKIQALANFVQTDVRYVAIELGIGGWQPHAAADVFTHRYGDCKDKATLLATMLKDIGVDASYVIVNTRRGAVTQSTPPNLGFDHVILAIQLPAGADDPGLLALTTHPKLGRILFFDPTDTYTPLGGLAGPLQGGFGLLVTADGSEIVHLPTLPVTASSQQRTAHLTLDADGTLRGEVVEVSTGDMAAFARSAVDTTAQDTDHIKPIESVMAQSFASYTVTSAVIRNRHTRDMPLEWTYNIDVPRFAESSGDILTLRPRVLGSQTTGFLETKEARENDIEFEGPHRNTDVFEISLPPGYVVDDMPQPIDADYPYAAYHSKTEVAGRTLKYTRSLEIKQVTVPVGQAENLKQFFRTIYNDESAVVVLRRTTGN